MLVLVVLLSSAARTITGAIFHRIWRLTGTKSEAVLRRLQELIWTRLEQYVWLLQWWEEQAGAVLLTASVMRGTGWSSAVLEQRAGVALWLQDFDEKKARSAGSSGGFLQSWGGCCFWYWNSYWFSTANANLFIHTTSHWNWRKVTYHAVRHDHSWWIIWFCWFLRDMLNV